MPSFTYKRYHFPMDIRPEGSYHRTCRYVNVHIITLGILCLDQMNVIGMMMELGKEGYSGITGDLCKYDRRNIRIKSLKVRTVRIARRMK